MSDTHPCPKCGLESPFNLRPDTRHHGEIRCLVHGHLWIAKPDELKAVRRKRNRKLIDEIPQGWRDFCWECLRHETDLKALRPSVGLDVHHILEVVKHGGTDDPQNLQVLCCECHAEVHRRREMFARYNAIAS
jgi:hypothetical protein